MKKCTVCNQIKSLDSFRKHKRGLKGIYSQCKECVKHHPLKWSSRVLKMIHSNSKSGKRYSKHKDNEIDAQHLVELLEKQKGRCYYSNIVLDLTLKCKLRSVSVDRLDNDKGYLKGNIVLSTRFFNLGRNICLSKDFDFFIKKYFIFRELG